MSERSDEGWQPSPVGTELLGTVRWWKDEKGYGRILGDDDYLYFTQSPTSTATAIEC